MKNVKVKRKKCHMELLGKMIDPNSVHFDSFVSKYDRIKIHMLLGGAWVNASLNEENDHMYIGVGVYNPDKFIIKDV